MPGVMDTQGRSTLEQMLADRVQGLIARRDGVDPAP